MTLWGKKGGKVGGGGGQENVNIWKETTRAAWLSSSHPCISFRITGLLEPMLPTVDRSPVCRSTTQSHTLKRTTRGVLETSVNLWRKFLVLGRKLEFPGKATRARGERRKVPAGIWTRAFQSQSLYATVCSIDYQCHYINKYAQNTLEHLHKHNWAPILMTWCRTTQTPADRICGADKTNPLFVGFNL